MKKLCGLIGTSGCISQRKSMAWRGKSLVAVEFMTSSPTDTDTAIVWFGSGKTLVAVGFMMPSGVGTCFGGGKHW